MSSAATPPPHPRRFDPSLRGTAALVALIVAVLVPAFVRTSSAQDATAGAANEAEALQDTEGSTETGEVLRNAFAEVPAFSQIRAVVRHRVAILAGRVDTPAAREAAVTIARKLPDLLYVDNRIEVAEADPSPAPDASAASRHEPTPQDQAVQETLSSVFAQVKSLRAIDVRVRGGVVVLEGQAASAEGIEEAGELAAAQDGVLYVDNRLTESKDVAERLSPLIDRFFAGVRDTIASAPLVLIALIVLVAAYFLARRVGAAQLQTIRYLRDNPLLLGIVRRLLMLAVLLIGLFIALQVMGMGFVLGALLGGAGIVGVALSFAFRDIIENFLAGIILSIRQPFRSKDMVRINAEEGNVIRLTPSATILMTADGNHVRIPNSDVFKGVVTNLTRNPLRRFDFAIGVASDSDLRSALSRGTEVMRAVSGVLANPEPFAWVEGIGDSNVILRYHGWVDQRASSLLKVKGAAIRSVMGALHEDGIEMPEPTYRLAVVGGGDDTMSAVAKAAAHERPSAAAKPTPEPTASSEPEDTSPDSTIEDQIEEEQREGDHPDLLTPGGTLA